MLESISKILYFLGVDPIWVVILLISLVAKGLFPYKLRGKSIKTKDKDGNIVTKYFEFKEY